MLTHDPIFMVQYLADDEGYKYCPGLHWKHRILDCYFFTDFEVIQLISSPTPFNFSWDPFIV